MCLYIRDKEPRVAKKDIVVLKYLKKKNKRFYSPCQGTPVTIGKVCPVQGESGLWLGGQEPY